MPVYTQGSFTMPNKVAPQAGKSSANMADDTGPGHVTSPSLHNSSVKVILRRLLRNWKFLLVVFLPLLLLPMIAVPGLEIRCAYMLIVMAVFWMTEALPVAVTALLPIVMAPLLGIQGGKTITKNYANDTVFLFLGGLTVAICVETWNLHKRIAIRMLLLVGISPRWLMFGFMMPTWFLSMWISNTATTAMMIPITAAVLQQIKHVCSTKPADTDDWPSRRPEPLGNDTSELVAMKERTSLNEKRIGENSSESESETRGEASTLNRTSDVEVKSTFSEEEAEPEDLEYVNLCKAMSLCIAYAANCGGISTLTGTAPNLVLMGQLETLFGNTCGINFMTWMIFALPISLISLITCWVWLGIYYLGPRKFFLCRGGDSAENDSRVGKVLQEEYSKLGSMGFHEWATLVSFILLVLLWITRVSEFFPGWGTLFTPKFATDGTAAVLIALLLFVIPSAPIRLSSSSRPPPPLLNWEVLVHKMPWGVILLLGGGFAIADASKASGLSDYIGQQLGVLEVLPPVAIVLCVSTLIAAVTEVSSNTATTALMLPILAEMARSINMNPLFLMLPGTVSASFAFMLPVATPPNAVVFSYGHLRITDMMKAGFVMNVICVLYVTLAVNTWGYAYFNLGQMPEWALSSNTTIVPVLNVTSV